VPQENPGIGPVSQKGQREDEEGVVNNGMRTDPQICLLQIQLGPCPRGLIAYLNFRKCHLSLVYASSDSQDSDIVCGWVIRDPVPEKFHCAPYCFRSEEGLAFLKAHLFVSNYVNWFNKFYYLAVLTLLLVSHSLRCAFSSITLKYNPFLFSFLLFSCLPVFPPIIIYLFPIYATLFNFKNQPIKYKFKNYTFQLCWLYCLGLNRLSQL